MKRSTILAFLGLLALAGPALAQNHETRTEFEIMGQVVPKPGQPDSDKLSVKINGGSVTSMADTFTGPSTSTGSAGASASLAIEAQPNAKGTFLVNESTSPIRVGGSNITPNVGLFVGPNGGNIGPDTPGVIFKGKLYVVGTTGYGQKFSTFQGVP